jgi:DNA invertase Pin-like site-specific DNA recombinase
MENMEFMKAMLAKMNASMRANQEKADTNTKAMQERMNEMKDEIKDDVDAKRKADRENLKEMREEIQSGQVELRSIINAWIADMKND